MPLTFPCPNPVCTQLIDAEAIKGAASLTCPSCGTKLDFRTQPTKPPAAAPKAATPKPPNTAPKTAAPTKPVAAPPAKPAAAARPVGPRPVPMVKPIAPQAKPAGPPIPTAKPAVAAPAPRAPAKPPPLPPRAAPAVPMASPVAAAPSAAPNLAFGSQPDMVLTTPRRRAGLPAWLVAALVVIPVFGGVTTLILAFTFNWFNYSPSDPSALTPEEKRGLTQQGNFHFTPPIKPWKQDKNLQLNMKVNLAYRRTGGSVMVLLFKDYQKRQPRDAELIDETLNKIRGYLTGVEYEIKPKDDKSRLSDQPAVPIEFTGEDPQHVQVNGECLTTAYRGIGYWFFTWGPLEDHDQLAGEWGTLRQSFALGDQREGWTEAKPKMIAIQGNRLPYKMEYAEGLWDKRDLDGYDSHADVVLVGYDPRDREARQGDMAATVQVLALEKAKDLPEAVKLAKDALLEIEKEKQAGADTYNFPGATLQVVGDKALHNADNDADVGGFRGHITKFEAKKSADHSKYVVLGVVRQEEAVLAVVCECAWERRDYWEQEFTPLLDKLKPAKGK